MEIKYIMLKCWLYNLISGSDNMSEICNYINVGGLTVDLKRKSQSVCLFLSVLSFISRFLYDFSLATDMAEGGIYDDIQFINPEEEEDSPGEEEGEGHERGLGRGGGRRDIECQEVCKQGGLGGISGA